MTFIDTVVIIDVTESGLIIIEFRIIAKADKPIFDQYFRARRYENSHFNFTNIFMWKDPYNMRWCEDDGVLYMLAEWKGEIFSLQPFGPQEKMAEALEKILAYFSDHHRPFKIFGMEGFMLPVLSSYTGTAFAIESNRDEADYVYRAEDLINLSGRRYHAKKNHLNSFHKNYPEAEYRAITPEIVSLCKMNVDVWYRQRASDLPDDPFIALERAATIAVLDNFHDFHLKGGAILVDGRVVAFSFGEQLNQDTAVIHVEKADPSFRGAYPAINQAFVAQAWSGMAFINREEDMGLAGLRQAKESYKPVKMVEKYTAVVKE